MPITELLNDNVPNLLPVTVYLDIALTWGNSTVAYCCLFSDFSVSSSRFSFTIIAVTDAEALPVHINLHLLCVASVMPHLLVLIE